MEKEDLLPFEEEFQEKVAALSIRDSNFVRRTQGLISPDQFENEAQSALIRIAADYYGKYKMLPESTSTWVEILKESRASLRIRDDLYTDMIHEFKALKKADVSDRDYVVDQVGKFAKHRAVAKATLLHIDLVDKGRFDEAQALMETAFRVGAANERITTDYWNDIERRTQYRKDIVAGVIKPNGISTGVKKLDGLLYHHGWGRKEMSVIMGGAKKGKSMGLGEFAVRASILGYNVIYISLEVSIDIIADRLDANLSSTEMNSLKERISDVDGKIKMKAAARGRGSLKVVDFPSGTFTPSDLRRLLDRERADGVQFDLVVVDYADIMAPDVRSNNEIADSKQVWLGLRAIAWEEDCAMLTATQTNRDGFKASVAKAEHAAEDFNKIRIADLVLSINRSDEETAAGEARLYFAASRNQGGEFSVHIKQNLAAGQFITSIDKIT